MDDFEEILSMHEKEVKYIEEEMRNNPNVAYDIDIYSSIYPSTKVECFFTPIPIPKHDCTPFIKASTIEGYKQNTLYVRCPRCFKVLPVEKELYNGKRN